LISKLKIKFCTSKSRFFDIEVFIDSSGQARVGAGLRTENAGCSSVLESLNTDCSAGNSLQLSFWLRLSNSTLSDQHDGVAGDAKAKAASRMAQRPPVAQAKLTQFNKDLFRADGPLSLVSYGTGCFVLPVKWNSLSVTMKGPGSLQLLYFWRRLAP
jgi:hypothetical protein